MTVLNMMSKINLFLSASVFNLRESHPLITLSWGHEEGVQHGHSLAQHGDLQLMLLLEMLDEFFQCHFSVHLKPIPQGPLLVVVLWEKERKIEKYILYI